MKEQAPSSQDLFDDQASAPNADSSSSDEHAYPEQEQSVVMREIVRLFDIAIRAKYRQAQHARQTKISPATTARPNFTMQPPAAYPRKNREATEVRKEEK